MNESILTLINIISHIRNREYMSGIERDMARVKSTAEVFTPTSLVRRCLDDLDQELFKNTENTVIDRACGDGAWLGEILIRKLENGSTFEQALSTIYGVDLMPDNIALCRERLLCGQESLRFVVERNIVCADTMRYNFKFDGTDPYKTERDSLLDDFFQFGHEALSLPAPDSPCQQRYKQQAP